MSSSWPLKFVAVLLPALLSVGCDRPIVPRTQAASFTKSAQDPPPEHRAGRAAGIVRAIHSVAMQPPQLAGLGARLTPPHPAPRAAQRRAGRTRGALDRAPSAAL